MAYPLKFLFRGNTSSFVMPEFKTPDKFGIRGSIKNHICEEKCDGKGFE